MSVDFRTRERIESTTAPALVDLPALDRDWRHHAWIRLPAGVADLSPTARGLLVLDVIDVAALWMAELAGWDPTRLAPARQYVLDKGLEFQWASTWKSSPDRRHKARLHYRIDDDGQGRGRIEVTAGATLRATGWAHCGGAYKRVAARLRWEGSGAVSLDALGGPVLAPQTNPELVRHPARTAPTSAPLGIVQLDDLREAVDPAPVVDVEAPRPAVILTMAPPPGQGAHMHSRRHQLLPSEAFNQAMRQTMQSLTTPEWEAWWEPAGLGTLELTYSLLPWVDERV